MLGGDGKWKNGPNFNEYLKIDKAGRIKENYGKFLQYCKKKDQELTILKDHMKRS